jgi:hypothetical protein
LATAGSGSGGVHVVLGREGGFDAVLDLGALSPGDEFVFESSAQLKMDRSIAPTGCF